LIAERLSGIVPCKIAQLAVLLTSEIVTNAVRYAGGVVLRLTARPDAIRVSVHDDSTRMPQLCSPTAIEERGRGLAIVSALASRWGCEPTASGKAVWFELDR
jgi:anti-sigma regulatory factor (Ser/Thr protein kinase)